MGEPRLSVSFCLTWINAIMTVAECVVIPYLLVGHFGSLIYSGGLLGFMLITLALIQFLDKCSCCCSDCFERNCLPMTKKIVYDPEKPGVLC